MLSGVCLFGSKETVNIHFFLSTELPLPRILACGKKCSKHDCLRSLQSLAGKRVQEEANYQAVQPSSETAFQAITEVGGQAGC